MRLGLVLLAVLAFSSALGNRPEALDDQRIIYEQAFLREGRLLACLSPWPAREEWLPLRDLTYLLDFALHGARPAGLVVGNLLLHGALVLAVHALARRVLRGELAAAAAAALFAVHPLHAESVAWLSGRKDSLSGLFVVACVTVWLDALRARRAGELRTQALVVALALAALLSKASAVCLLLLVPLADLLLGTPRPLAARAASWAPVGLLCAAFAPFYAGLVRAWGDAHGQQVIKAFPGDAPWTILCTDAAVVPQYLLAFVWPQGRLFSAQGYRTAVDAEVAVGLVVSLAALAGALALARRRPSLGFAALWSAAALAPFLNLTPHGIPFAERYAHLASVGACLLLGAGVAAAAGGRRARVALVVALLAFAGTWRCRALGRVFETGETLWTHVLRVEPDNAVAAANLGSWYEDQGDLAGAERWFREALRLEPTRATAHMGLARALGRAGRHEEALEAWRQAARARPRDVRPVYGAADALHALGRREDALRLFDAIIATWPAASERAAYNRAVLVTELAGPDAGRAAWAEYRARWGAPRR